MRSLRIALLMFAACTMAAAQTPTASGSQTGTAVSNPTSTSARGTSAGRMVLPTDTEIEVRVNDPLSSETSQQGDRFTGQVASDVVDRSSGRVLIPKDAQVSGRVLTATPSGRLSDAGELQLSINTIRVGDSVVNVAVQPFVDKGESHTRSNTTKIGGGAALGAIIGAIAGGGKGAAIGAGVGGAAGAAGAAATGKRPAEVKPEAVLKFVTAAETTVPASVQLPSTASSQTTGTNDSTYSPSTTTDSDNAPVLQKRGESTPSSTAASSSSTNTSISGTSSTTAANSTAPTVPNTSSTGTSGTYGQSNPPASSTSSTNSSIGVQANGTGSSTGIGVGSTNNSYPSTTAPSTTSATNAQVPGRSFSARDRRVINNCIRDHASTLPDSALRKATGVSTAFKAGDTVPTETQRQLRSLPLQCDRELPMLGNDLERVIYGGQVMLIDSTNRVLDAFDVTP